MIFLALEAKSGRIFFRSQTLTACSFLVLWPTATHNTSFKIQFLTKFWYQKFSNFLRLEKLKIIFTYCKKKKTKQNLHPDVWEGCTVLWMTKWPWRLLQGKRKFCPDHHKNSLWSCIVLQWLQSLFLDDEENCIITNEGLLPDRLPNKQTNKHSWW